MVNLNVKDFSVVSYNLHGYNQGAPLLKSMCSSNEFNIDCICIQEHWLTPFNLNKLSTFSPDY